MGGMGGMLSSAKLGTKALGGPSLRDHLPQFQKDRDGMEGNCPTMSPSETLRAEPGALQLPPGL